MRTQHQLLKNRKEHLILVNRKRQGGFAARPDRDIPFLLEANQDTGKVHEERGGNFMDSVSAESGLSPREELKEDLFWFFVKYFFEQSHMPLKQFMAKIERNIILSTLYEVNGGQRRTAEILGLKYTTLNEKVKKYGIRIRK